MLPSKAWENRLVRSVAAETATRTARPTAVPDLVEGVDDAGRGAGVAGWGIDDAEGGQGRNANPWPARISSMGTDTAAR